MVFLHYAHTVIAPGVSPLYCYENRTINTVPLLHYSTHCKVCLNCCAKSLLPNENRAPNKHEKKRLHFQR
jgi:hypothetical protein